MTAFIQLDELAGAVLPDECRKKVSALLNAYFDESGIHRGSPVTFVAGFVGTTREWRDVKKQWVIAMNGETFHYKEMALETEMLERDSDNTVRLPS